MDLLLGKVARCGSELGFQVFFGSEVIMLLDAYCFFPVVGNAMMDDPMGCGKLLSSKMPGFL